MIGFNRIQRYILMQCISGLAIVTILLVDVVEQMRTVGGDVDLSPLEAVRLSTLKLPGLIEQTLPFAILVAAMIAYRRLNARAELSVIRASGISAWQFLAPIIVMSLVLGVFTMTVLNPLGANLSQSFETARAQILQEDGANSLQTRNDVWLRQGSENSQIVIHADSVDETGQVFQGVKMIEEDRIYIDGQPTDEYGFVRRIDAETARITNGFWQLETIVENEEGSPPQTLDQLAIPTDLDADKLLDRFTSPNTIGFWGLPAFVKQTRQAGLDASRFEMRWYGLTAVPVMFVAMGLIGAIVCLRLSRLGGTSPLVAAGGLSAVALFFVTQFASSLGSTGALPPIIAAWSPALFALFASLTILAYREDG